MSALHEITVRCTVAIPSGYSVTFGAPARPSTRPLLARLKLPSKAALERELSVVKRERIPLLVVTGGWSPAFEVTADTVASHGNGRRFVVKSEHHFPHQVSNDFNQVLEDFMKEHEVVRFRRSPD